MFSDIFKNKILVFLLMLFNDAVDTFFTNVWRIGDAFKARAVGRKLIPSVSRLGAS